MRTATANSRALLVSSSHQTGSIRSLLLLAIVVIGGFMVVTRISESHVAADSPKIMSGISGYCLDDHNNSLLAGSAVNLRKCNDSTAQNWTVTPTSIMHDSSHCLAVNQNASSSGSSVVLNSCSAASGQVWLHQKGGYENPNSGLCLSAPATKKAGPISMTSCANLADTRTLWIATAEQPTSATSCNGSEGAKVACTAAAEWTAWQADHANHTALLTAYTDGASYEEWCADFVSYVYKQAGYPFTGGETDGWNENIADNIQNMGFTKHMASSGYLPKAGDVAYFDYSGGHVEIVVSGGKTPTFIYGNSGTIDPTTGNGQMAANTITSDQDGQVTYYLSPS
jgi:hypothetical protein